MQANNITVSKMPKGDFLVGLLILSCRANKDKAKIRKFKRNEKNYKLAKKLGLGTNRAAAQRPIPGLEQPPERFV